MNLLDRMIGEADVCKNKVNKADKEFHNPPFTITKADEDKRLVFGWALVSADKDGNKLIDHQGDMVDPDDLEDGAYEYVLNFRDAGEEHIGTLRKKARMVESCVFTPEKMKAIGIPEGTIPVGWWIGFYVDDDTTWERIKSGKYKMFSIEGKAVREPVTKNAFDEWLEDHLDADEETQRNMKEKLDRPRTVAKTFSEIVEKFNPYHDSKGRFTSGSGGNYASFTYAPGKSKAHDNAIARERERAAQRSNAASGPKPMTEYEYLSSKGVGDASSGWSLDKLRGNRQVGTQRGKERFRNEAEKAEAEYQKRREQAKQEYKEKVRNGELRDKTTIERMIDRANGHPDNPSTQAARRMAEKRGIDWRTGKPLKDTQSGAATSNKIKQEFIDAGLNSKFKGVQRNAREGKGAYAYKDAVPVSEIDASKISGMQFVEHDGKTLVHGILGEKKVFYANNSDSKEIKALRQKAEESGQKRLEEARHRPETRTTTTTYDRWKRNHDKNFADWFGVGKSMTFNEIAKFNPYHDRLGRFTSGGSATSFTIRTKDPSKQHMADIAIAREKERSSSGVKTGNYTETKPQQKPQKESNTADTPQKKSLHTVEDKIRHQFYESAAVVDKDGNVLFKKDGAQSQVGFTNKEVKMMDGNSLTHNHPSSSMFSTEDITMLVKSGLSEIRATTREGITYSVRKGTGYDSAKGMRFLVNYDGERKSAMRHAQATLDGRGYYGKIMDGKITQEQANHDFGKVMSSQMVRWCNTQSKKYGVDFEVERREVPKKDKVNIGYASKSFNDDDKFVLDRDSEKEMQDAFNEWLSNHKEKTAKSFNDFLKERR